MKKIFKSLIFPAISLLVVAIIYAGLSIANLNNQTKVLQEQNQKIIFDTNNLSDKFNQLQSEIGQTKTLISQSEKINSDLKKELATAKQEIAALQGRENDDQPQADTAPEPVIITKTVTQTINQQVEANRATVIIENVGSFSIDLQATDNAFSVLERASIENHFALTYDTYGFGVFITGIGGITPIGNQYWAFYYNGTYSNVGASDQPIKKGDTTVWQLASF
ncbi:MAG: Uncharacterized protein Athens101428_380 [Candidatus Berkelbacteria bacterium Athens1014_28]|uniref:Transcobalamin-like C-terminal domain-containing protein n=1 Tax=Candidatus Berkelbacteria bacterium Athens1014_28 TaxID=2017145 RepID=A0A554LN25_9BACT|nr:MAG: Uncharacterized protein Athens101428_380 [Candidatus Berkelbacteria bacterium Athens1014_28]